MTMTMTAAKTIEYQVTREVLSGRHPSRDLEEEHKWADRLILVLATTAVMVVFGSFLQELLWVALAGATTYTLGQK